jgi:hypothetical protein
MEDLLYAVTAVVMVSTVAAHSFIWTWVWLRRHGLLQPKRSRELIALEERMAQLERENSELAVEIERLGEARRFEERLGAGRPEPPSQTLS